MRLTIVAMSWIMMAMGMINGQRYQTEWDGLRLIIEARSDHWIVFVYDPIRCEVLYTAERMNPEAANSCAVEYAATNRFGPRHDLKPEVVAAMLFWDSGEESPEVNPPDDKPRSLED